MTYNGTVYLNKRGTRFLVYRDGKVEPVRVIINGVEKEYTPKYYRSFGNYVYAGIRIGKKVVEVLPEGDNNEKNI